MGTFILNQLHREKELYAEVTAEEESVIEIDERIGL